jgi:hypothetical protein
MINILIKLLFLKGNNAVAIYQTNCRCRVKTMYSELKKFNRKIN